MPVVRGRGEQDPCEAFLRTKSLWRAEVAENIVEHAHRENCLCRGEIALTFA
jgi:hypothetical protein